MKKGAFAVGEYSIQEFDDARLAATRKAWTKALDQEPAEFNRAVFDRRLNLAEQSRDYAAGSEFCYGIFKTGNSAASAIVELSYTKQSSRWIKMLNLHLSPSLDLSIDKNSPNFRELAGVFSAAIVGTIKLTGVHKSRVVKLYARTPLLLSFFQFIAEQLPKQFERMNDGAGVALKLSIDGRWLVIKI